MRALFATMKERGGAHSVAVTVKSPPAGKVQGRIAAHERVCEE
jgi:hypothetical protein